MVKKYILFVCFVALGLTNSFAQTYVSSTGDDGTGDGSEGSPYLTVSKAITETSTGGTIIIVGTISQSGSDIDLNTSSKNLTFQGQSNAVITGDGTNRMFNISQAVTISFEDITFQSFGSIVKGSVMFASHASADITFRDCVFSSNTIANSNGGGAIHISNSTLTIEDTTFSGNSNTSGGGGAILITGSTIATISGTTFYNNSTTARGGAILAIGSSSTTITNSTFFNNTTSKTATFEGAGIRVNVAGVSLTATNCLFYDNKTSTGDYSDFTGIGTGNLHLINSLAQFVTNLDTNTNSTITGSDYLSESSLTWNATTNQLNFSAASSIATSTPIDYGNDNSDIGAWDSKINLFKGTTDSDWATDANWSSTAAPTSSENVTLLSDSPAVVVASSTAAVCNDLSVNASSSLTINSGGTLIVNGTSSGNVTYNRTLGTTNWYLMSSPVAGVTFDDAFVTANNIASGTGNNRGVATYNTSTDNWTYLQSGGSISSTPGVGYSVKQATAGDVAFTGTINTSDVSVAVSSAGNGFNLIGNPFTASLNTESFLSGNSANLVAQTIWVWDQSTSNYETHNSVTSFVLAPTQGFFVRSSNGTNMSIAESYQTTGGTFQRSSKKEIKLMMTDGTLDRFARIFYLDDNATKGYDNGYDGETFSGVSNSFDVFTSLLENSQGKKYQIQSLPNSDYENMAIPVGVIASAGKQITFSAETMNLPAGLKVFLEDRETNTFTRLDEANTEYTITLDKALHDIGRFYVHTSASALSTPEAHLENISIYTTNSNNLRIVGIAQGNASVKLYNIVGKEVLSHNFISNGVSDLTLPKLTRGIYIVQLTTEEGKLNKKIVLD